MGEKEELAVPGGMREVVVEDQGVVVGEEEGLVDSGVGL